MIDPLCSKTPTQLQRLRRLGCNLGQGFLLGRPLDAVAIRAIVANPAHPDWATALAA